MTDFDTGFGNCSILCDYFDIVLTSYAITASRSSLLLFPQSHEDFTSQVGGKVGAITNIVCYSDFFSKVYISFKCDYCVIIILQLLLHCKARLLKSAIRIHGIVNSYATIKMYNLWL